MRWFKHLSDAHNDESMAELIDEFGAAGYGVWWIILEKIAAQMDKSGRCDARYSFKKWSKSCGLSVKKFQKTVSFLTKLEKLSAKVCEKNSNFLIIECRNLLKFRDEYSKKSGHTPDRRRIKSGHTPHQETETETETETEVFNSDNDKPLSKSGKIDFRELLMENEMPYLKIFSACLKLRIWKPPAELHIDDLEYRKWVLKLTKGLKRLGCEDAVIVKTINDRDMDRARQALAFTCKIKKKVESEGKAIENINGFFLRAYQRNYSTTAMDVKLSGERLSPDKKQDKNTEPTRREATTSLNDIFSGVAEHESKKREAYG